MKLIIREKKELIDIEDWEMRQELDFGFFLFEILAFDLPKFLLNKRSSSKNTIRTLNDFFIRTLEISELLFYLLWLEIEREYRGDDEMPVPNEIIERLEDFLWALDGRTALDDCDQKQLKDIKEAYITVINRYMIAQDIFSFVCKFCFDVDYDDYPLDGATTHQKWYIFSKSAEFTKPREFVERFAAFSEETMIVQPGELFYSDSLLHTDSNELYNYMDEPLKISKAIERYRSIKLEPLKVFQTDNIIGLLYAEFWSMVAKGTRIKKCRLCGKYFIPFSENSEYCYRIYMDKGKSCQDYAPMVIHRQKIQGDKLLSVYTKAKNARYMRHKRNPALYTREKLDTWLTEAKKALDNAKHDDISASALKDALQKL